jgi:hypothetical protein
MTMEGKNGQYYLWLRHRIGESNCELMPPVKGYMVPRRLKRFMPRLFPMRIYLALILSLFTVANVSWASKPGPACIDKAIQEALTGFFTVCGPPWRGRNSNTLYAYFSDDGWRPPEYDPHLYCGADTPDGLGILRIRYKPLARGDCQIRDVQQIR